MILKFKKDIDIKKVIPVIEEHEWELIKDISISVDKGTVEQIKKKGSFVLFKDDAGEKCISAELFDIKEDDGSYINEDYEEIKKLVDSKFIFSKDVAEILLRGFDAKKNVLLYGKGGHAKSEITEMVTNELYKRGLISGEPFIKALGDGLTQEELFGGIDIKEMKDTGRLVYLYENSFLNHEVVIFEEIFDAPPQVLLALKDVLTSGYARNGNQKFKMKCKVIIALTNKSKEEFASDDSLEALTQRFPLSMRVEWDSYNKNNFVLLFKKVFGLEFFEEHKTKLITLSEILAANNDPSQSTSFCSPRTAITAAQIFCSGGDLKFIGDIDQKIVKSYFKDIREQEELAADQLLLEKIDNFFKNNSLEQNELDMLIIQMAAKELEKSTGNKVTIKESADTTKIVNSLKFIQGVIDAHKFNIKNKSKFENIILEIKNKLKKFEI